MLTLKMAMLSINFDVSANFEGTMAAARTHSLQAFLNHDKTMITFSYFVGGGVATDLRRKE
jgi:hypothetical protein